MKNFKNLINQTEFKVLFENHKVKSTTLFNKYKLNEEQNGMDFGNRTGFGESLVGRAINKIFSFVATKVEEGILIKLKTNLDSVYKKAVIATIVAMKLENILSEESEESEKINAKEIITSTLAYTQTQTLEQGSTSTDEIVELFNLTELQKEKYKELQILEKKIKEKQQEKYMNDQDITDTDYEDVEKIVVFDDNSENKIESQKKMISSLMHKIKIKDLTDDNKLMLKKIIKNFREELKKVGNEIDDETKNDYENFIKTIEDYINDIDGEISDEVYKERINKYKNTETNENKIYEDVTETPQNQSSGVTTPQVITPQEQSSEVALNQNKEETIEDLKKERDEKVEEFAKSIDEVQQKIIKTTFINKKTPIKKDVVIAGGDTDEIKNAINKTGNFDANNIDLIWDKISEEQKIKFIKISSTYVNKELLKIVALKAEALYNLDDYKDERDKIYSRVNFSTTHPDKKKLKRKWLIMVSEVKAKYMKYFSSNGSFPSDLDPIALMNSDNKENGHRNRFDEYIKDGKMGGNYDGLNSNTPIATDCNLKDLGLTLNKDSEHMFYEIKLNDDSRIMGILFRHIETDDLHIYQFKGIIDIEPLYKELALLPDCNDNDNDERRNKIKEIVDKYYLTTKKLSEKSSGEENKKIQEIYETFRPKEDGKDNITLYLRKTAFNKSSNNIKFFVLNIDINSKEMKLSTYADNKFNEFISLDENQNINKDQIKFSFSINLKSRVDSESVFEKFIKTKHDINNNEIIDKALQQNKENINIIKKIMWAKK